jgi:hypothetical protein
MRILPPFFPKCRVLRGPYTAYRGPYRAYRGPYTAYRGPYRAYRGPCIHSL